MLTISLHGIKLHAKVGLYPEERINGNDFEIDVDVFVDGVKSEEEFPFIDYSIIHQIVNDVFQKQRDLLETVVKEIHQKIKNKLSYQCKVKVEVRKLNPPLPGEIAYAQVSFIE